MLNHPEMGPNATINRWIEKILMFHFELRHVAGKTFGPDGLSRRDQQEGDEEYAPNEDLDDINKPPILTVEEGSEPPLAFEEFKDRIDTRGGYLQGLAVSVESFNREIKESRTHCQLEKNIINKREKEGANCEIAQYTNQFLLPESGDIKDEGILYLEDQRTKSGIIQDERLPLIKQWLQKPFVKPLGMDDHEYRN